MVDLNKKIDDGESNVGEGQQLDAFKHLGGSLDGMFGTQAPKGFSLGRILGSAGSSSEAPSASPTKASSSQDVFPLALGSLLSPPPKAAVETKTAPADQSRKGARKASPKPAGAKPPGSSPAAAKRTSTAPAADGEKRGRGRPKKDVVAEIGKYMTALKSANNCHQAFFGADRLGSGGPGRP